jgi:hypothetical protein
MYTRFSKRSQAPGDFRVLFSLVLKYGEQIALQVTISGVSRVRIFQKDNRMSPRTRKNLQNLVENRLDSQAATTSVCPRPFKIF